jgi:hypothetical protein
MVLGVMDGQIPRIRESLRVGRRSEPIHQLLQVSRLSDLSSNGL